MSFLKQPKFEIIHCDGQFTLMHFHPEFEEYLLSTDTLDFFILRVVTHAF